jgi:glutathione S-transferase
MEQWVSLINCHGYDAMVRRYVLQYVFAKDGAPGPPRDRSRAAGHQAAAHDLDKAYGTRNFLVGDAVTMADLFLAPIVAYLAMFPESKALLDSVPNVTRAHKAIAERESFKATMPKFD